MHIQSLVPRESAVTIRTKDGTPYLFKHVAGMDSPMVATIENPRHIQQLLAIKEGFAEYRGTIEELLTPAVTPTPTGTTETETNDNETDPKDPLKGKNLQDMDEEELREAAQFFNMRVWPANTKKETMQRQLQEMLDQRHQEDLDELNQDQTGSDTTPAE